jgi:hypothetical protein
MYWKLGQLYILRYYELLKRNNRPAAIGPEVRNKKPRLSVGVFYCAEFMNFDSLLFHKRSFNDVVASFTNTWRNSKAARVQQRAGVG